MPYHFATLRIALAIHFQVASASVGLAQQTAAPSPADGPAQVLFRVGLIGLDTSHVQAFTKIMNAVPAEESAVTPRVTVAYPPGSPDIPGSTSRVPQYTKDIAQMGVTIVDSIDTLVDQVDGVLLESNDGRPHLAQALPVLRARKPLFIDKPMAASLEDVIAIFLAAEFYKTPVFSSSGLRFTKVTQQLRAGELGEVLGCDTYSPANLEPTHPDLAWYAIHGVERLFAVMGTGCQEVSRTSTADFDLVTGVWAGGRIGTVRGIRKGPYGFGGTAFTLKEIIRMDDFGGYEPLVKEICKFLATGKAPVSQGETIELFAFIAAAEEAKGQSGGRIKLGPLVVEATKKARAKLAALQIDSSVGSSQRREHDAE